MGARNVSATCRDLCSSSRCGRATFADVCLSGRLLAASVKREVRCAHGDLGALRIYPCVYAVSARNPVDWPNYRGD